MGRKTGIIKFNLTDRMRKYRGAERNFDIAAAVRVLNSPAVQERIKHGDMIGYFGHWPRVEFGIDPAEGGFVKGRQISLEPSHRTTFLYAHPDGTVEHEQEFLDTESGKIANRIWGSNAYGFSSAIDSKRLGTTLIPVGFYGFDFVKEPNYSSNRGYVTTFDGVFENEDVLDAVSERNAMFEALNAVLDGVNSEHARVLETLDRVLQENEQLMSMLAKAGKPQQVGEIVLDGCLDLVRGSTHTRFDQANEFLHQDLVPYEKEGGDAKQVSPSKAADKALGRHFRH